MAKEKFIQKKLKKGKSVVKYSVLGIQHRQLGLMKDFKNSVMITCDRGWCEYIHYSGFTMLKT